MLTPLTRPQSPSSQAASSGDLLLGTRVFGRPQEKLEVAVQETLGGAPVTSRDRLHIRAQNLVRALLPQERTRDFAPF